MHGKKYDKVIGISMHSSTVRKTKNYWKDRAIICQTLSTNAGLIERQVYMHCMSGNLVQLFFPLNVYTKHFRGALVN